MDDPEMEVQLGGAVLSVCRGTGEEVLAIDLRVSLGPVQDYVSAEPEQDQFTPKHGMAASEVR